MQSKKEKYLRHQLVILNINTIKITFLISWIGSEKYLYVEGERSNVDIYTHINNINIYIHMFVYIHIVYIL